MQEKFEQRQIFNLLSEFSIQMTSILDIDQLITYFVSSIAKIFKADRVSLMLLDQSKKELFIKASHGFSPPKGSSKIKLGEMFSGWVAEQGKPLLVKDIEAEFPHLVKDKPAKYQSKSFVIAPVKLKDAVIGILNVTDREVDGIFTDNDLKIINTLCHWLAIHIENVKLSEKNANLVTIDNLTKVFNHRYFQEQLTEEIYRAERYQHPLSLLMLDIDNFSCYNQNYGYSTGDNALKQIGRVLKENIRRVDSPARYGPEEFMVILPNTELKEAIFVGERIKEAVSYSVFVEDKASPLGMKRLTVSVGVAGHKNGLTKEKLIQGACDALLEAKQKGKNCVCASK